MANITLTGVAAFSRLKNLDPEFNNWNITIYPDKKSKTAYVKAGGEGAFKTDEKGDKLTLRRYPVLKKSDGETVDLGPPYVKYNGQDFTQIIGNGSTVEVEIQPYPYKKNGGGIGMRLVGVNVKELVEYVPNAE